MDAWGSPLFASSGKEAQTMRLRTACLVAVLVLGVAVLITRPLLLEGQETAPPPSAPAPPANNIKPARDVTQLKPLGQQMLRAAQRGADWLYRANHTDGRFDYGFLPALQKKMDGDHYLRQVGAAFALAREARVTGNREHDAVARQALLTLLLDTVAEDGKTVVRHTAMPSVMVNRLAAAGLLVLAINELPEPTDDLLNQSEQLCAYIVRQQQADGSLGYCDAPEDAKAAAADPDGINYYPGEALYGLMRSQLHRRAAWKTDVVRKAVAYYRPWWQKHKNLAFVPWQSAAYTEAFLLTGEPVFAECVTEMNDWVCGLQYVQLDPRQPLWFGGFMGWTDGRPDPTEPQVGSAAYAEGLAEACRVARKTGDLARYQRYQDALERSLQFVVTLQYTDANTQHFAPWYRPRLVGGFHASHQDGNLRIDYAQHAVCALVQYVEYVAE
jgi:hypothetical protein